MVNYGRSELCPGGGLWETDAPVKFSDKDEPVVTVDCVTAPVNAFTIQDFPQYKPISTLSGRGLDMMRAVLAVFIVLTGIAKHSQHDSPFGENGLALSNKTFLLSLASLQKTVP
ncbi:hypothetical protein SPFM7_00193 [Salmonella phage SPFM7]|nr:hypothetical protein SPFM7_00193 [Salmonella phage SPFM7]